MKTVILTVNKCHFFANITTMSYLPSTLSALFVLLAILLIPSLAAADAGHDELEHDEAVTTIEPSALTRLLENRAIFLVVSIILMTLLTWGVFALVRVRPPNPPPPDTQPSSPPPPNNQLP